MIGKKKAFTLIEILIVMVIMAAMITIIPNWLFRKKADSTLSAVTQKLNNLLLIAKQEVLLSQKVCRLSFKSEKSFNDYVIIQKKEDEIQDAKKDYYSPVYSEYLDTKYEFPKDIKMEAAYLDKTELFSENKNEAYCYVMPNGLVQPIIIHVVRKVDNFEQKATLKVEPFIGEFELYNGFIKI